MQEADTPISKREKRIPGAAGFVTTVANSWRHWPAPLSAQTHEHCQIANRIRSHENR